MEKIYFFVSLFLVTNQFFIQDIFYLNAIRVDLEKTYLQLDYRPGGMFEIEEDSLEPKGQLTTVDTGKAGWNGTFDNKIAL